MNKMIIVIAVAFLTFVAVFLILSYNDCDKKLFVANNHGVIIDSFIGGSLDYCLWNINFVDEPELKNAPNCSNNCLIFYEPVRKPWQCLSGMMSNVTIFDNVVGRGVYFILAFDSYVRAGFGSESVADCFSKRKFVESAWFEYNGSTISGHVDSQWVNNGLVEEFIILDSVPMSQKDFYVLALRVLPDYTINFLVYNNSFDGSLLANITSNNRIADVPYRIKFSMYGGWAVLDEIGLYA